VAIIITTPDGVELKIDGTRVCRSASPEQCWEEPPEIIKLRITTAWDEGWPVKKVEIETV